MHICRITCMFQWYLSNPSLHLCARLSNNRNSNNTLGPMSCASQEISELGHQISASIEDTWKTCFLFQGISVVLHNSMLLVLLTHLLLMTFLPTIQNNPDTCYTFSMISKLWGMKYQWQFKKKEKEKIIILLPCLTYPHLHLLPPLQKQQLNVSRQNMMKSPKYFFFSSLWNHKHN